MFVVGALAAAGFLMVVGVTTASAHKPRRRPSLRWLLSTGP
jgi:hypothetical protein